MGLDAAAFTTATLTEPHERDDDCYESDHVLAYIIDPDFHRSLRGLVPDRCYQVAGREVTVNNSYGGHSRFREQLARVFLDVEPEVVWNCSEEFADRPFFELIHFADNEGTIGPDAAADLAADFADGREQWMAADVDEWSRRKYDEWAEAFRAASRGGLVRFA